MSDGFFDFVTDTVDTVGSALDVVDIGEVAMMIGTGATDVLTPGAEKVLGPISAAIDGFKVGHGGAELVDGLTGDTNDLQVVDGIHDLLDGGSGLLGNVPGPVGAVAKAFGAGFTVGDMIAPLVFGSEEEDNKPHFEDVPEDGVFKPSTGNDTIDGVLDIFGVRD